MADEEMTEFEKNLIETRPDIVEKINSPMEDQEWVDVDLDELP